MRLWKILMMQLVLSGAVLGQGARDLVVLEEDDPLGHRYYDASYGRAGEGNFLRLTATTGDKMPILQGIGRNSGESGLLEWRSAGKEDWEMYVYMPGFQVRDASGHEEVVLYLNGPAAMAKESLPKVGLQSGDGKESGRLELGAYLEGLDGDSGSWQRVAIPLKRFGAGTGFDLKRFRNVVFCKSIQERASRILWVDDVRLVDHDFVAPKVPPGVPREIGSRAGDRSVTLTWSAPGGEAVLGYNVYGRGSASEQMRRLNERLVTIHSFADVSVQNGRSYEYEVRAVNEAGESEGAKTTAGPEEFEDDEEFLEYVQGTAFDYFWREANPENGLVRDRSEPFSPASIAAVGFGLTAVGVGIDHGWISREAGRERVLNTLKFFWEAPQGTNATGTAGYRGWFYHFLEMESGERHGRSELSSIDTALLMMGVLYAREYFDGKHEGEAQIRDLADKIFARIDWKFMLNGGVKLSHGWFPERGFINARWSGYDEGSFLYILGLGAGERNRLDPESWKAWTSTYKWETHFGQSYVRFAPLFGHQYTACWVDTRYIADEYMRGKGITYFENSRRATLAQRAYCIRNPGRFNSYGTNVWGLTACDGPGIEGAHGYRARGAPPAEDDDGTIAPTAVGGSLPFAPEFCVGTLWEMYDKYREKLWHGYGFRDAFNVKMDWWGSDVIGIDQGPILLMAENLRTRRVWNVVKKSAVIQRGLERAGFKPRVGQEPGRPGAVD